MTLHVANLTNGTACAPVDALLARIQSTACEQKRWDAVLSAVPDHALVRLAQGEVVLVHDQSERARLTRAQWQGLSFTRYALRRSWHLPERPERTRSRGVVNRYWSDCYGSLTKSSLTRLRYYRRFVASDDVLLSPCGCPRIAWREAA